MGLEGKPPSIDDIIRGLDDGTIERGSKDTEDLLMPDGIEVKFHKENQTIDFPIAGIRVEFSLLSNTIRMYEPDTGNTIHDSKIEHQARHLAKTWEEQGLFDAE